MLNIQLEVAIAALILLILIIRSLRKNSMSIKSSVAWLLLPLIFIIIAIFPEPINYLSHFLGFETPSNFIFVITIALLLILCFSLTSTISRQSSQITKLVQEMSILKHQQGKSKNEKSSK